MGGKKKQKGEHGKFRQLMRAMDMERRQNKLSFRVYVVLRALVILALIRQAMNQNFENVFLCALTLLLLTIPSFVQVSFKIELPTTLEVVILLFIFAAEIMGEINEFYIKIPFWDTLLHTLNGFLAAAIGFSMVTLLNKDERITFKLSPFYLVMVAFCFSMTIGVMWEFFEWIMDCFFGLDMQKDTVITAIHSVALDPTGGNRPYSINGITSTVVNGEALAINGYLDIGLMDTMKDLLVNFIGALVFSTVGYFCIKAHDSSNFIWRFLLRRKKKEDDFLAAVQEEETAEQEKD